MEYALGAEGAAAVVLRAQGEVGDSHGHVEGNTDEEEGRAAPRGAKGLRRELALGEVQVGGDDGDGGGAGASVVGDEAPPPLAPAGSQTESR
jgi:hypothetical protein